MMQRRFKQAATIGLTTMLLVGWISGCSDTAGVTVRTEPGPGKKMDGIGQHWAWATRERSRVQDTRQVKNPQINALVVNGVEKRMANLGFVHQEQGLPDFWVDYRITSKELGDRVYGRTYDKGSLILDVVDPDDGSIIWRGSATVDIYDPVAPEVTEKRITYALDEMFKKFPQMNGPGTVSKPAS
jgi:hypothetical protein